MPTLTTTEKTGYDNSVTKTDFITVTSAIDLDAIEAGAEVNTINSASITNIESLTQAEYDALTPNASTLYIVTTPATKIYLGTVVIYSSI